MGCGQPQQETVTVDQVAHAKVEAFKRLADAMAKDPNGIEAKVALDEVRNSPLDVATHRKEAEEIVQIYRQRIQGKYQGEMAQEIQGEITPIQRALGTP
jgi:hypothetical protein